MPPIARPTAKRHPRRRTAALGASALALPLLATPFASAAVVDEPVRWTAPDARVALTPLGSYESGVFDESAAEIVAWYGRGERIFTVNSQAGTVDVLDASDPSAPTFVGSLGAEGVVAADGSTIPAGAVANSIAVRADGLALVAVEHPVKTEPGWLVVVDARSTTDATALDEAVLGAVRAGALPDMVTISEDGRYAVVANEGEPAEDFSVDPEGSVSVVALPRRVTAPTQSDVRHADFRAYDAPGALPDGVRVFGPTLDPERPVSTNLEPEYVAVVGSTAYVSLQEANAIAVVDLGSARVSDLWALGTKDHGLPGQGLDPSDRDGAIDIRTVEGLRGMYQPDAIAPLTVRGRTYLVTANEGDAREWGDYLEPARVKDLGDDGLAPICADSPLAALTGDADLGRLNVSTASGLSADGTCYEELYAFGARSISVWTTDGELVADTGDAFERVIAEAVPEFFNSNHSVSNLEGRSDDKGPEPEAITIGKVQGRTYAFVGLERVGGVMVVDLTEPTAPEVVGWTNNRDFSVSVEDDGVETLSAAGDLGPEGIVFVPGSQSPTRAPLVIVGSEVSGTTTVFEVESLLGKGSRR